MSTKYPESEAPEHPHGTAEDHDPTYILRRQLRFRSWHRGTKEADLLLGTFADTHLDRFDQEQLDLYAALLENNDADLYDWANGRADPPDSARSSVLDMLCDHKIADHL